MLKHTVSISSCLEVTVVALFCVSKPRRKLEVDSTHVKAGKALLSYFLAIYGSHLYILRSLWRNVNRQICNDILGIRGESNSLCNHTSD